MTRARARAKPSEPEAFRSETPDPGRGFSQPPPTSHGKYDWSVVEAECRAHPGKWYHVFTQDRKTIATAVRQGSVRRLAKQRGFEVLTRNNKTNVDPPVCDLWVRYVPSKDRHKEEASA